MSQPGWTLTKTYRREPYPAISPLRPELSQVGRTVLITGGTAGIGYAIARAFLQASAAKQEAQSTNQNAEIIGLAVDISNASAVEKLWAGLKEQGTVVDVLVLNAASISLQKPVLELGTEGLWSDFNVNVRAQFDMAERFYKQEGKPVDRPLYLVHVSTSSIHDWNTAGKHHGYGASKPAGATVLQMIALETSPDEMQVVNFNPGPNYTQATKDAGYSREDFDWYDENLSGQFAVWFASPEAKFLHGRFVWVSRDVDELKGGELRKLIDEDELFLKTGVRGL
ncbi:hypothetical protein DL769_000045 [Monosporascus sp. CRB-8-3]|nr:hypothetical protein DL769_000045 [Monosporascus sp. CRB-8-3]